MPQLLYLRPSFCMRSCSVIAEKKNVRLQNFAAQTRRQQLDFFRSLAPPLMAAIIASSPVFYSPGAIMSYKNSKQ